jgi:hypothetical protein
MFSTTLKLLLALIVLAVANNLQAQDMTPFRDKKGLWGFKDAKGNVRIAPKWTNKPEDFSEGRSIVTISYGQKGVIDEKGKLLTSRYYSDIKPFKHGMAVASLRIQDTTRDSKGKVTKTETIIHYGLLNKEGKEALPVEYGNLQGDFSNGWFVVLRNKQTKDLYIDTKGKPFELPDNIGSLNTDPLNGKLFIASKQFKYGLVDRNLKIVLPLEYQLIRPAGEGLLLVRKDNKLGLMDMNLKWVLEPTYSRLTPFTHGYAVFGTDDNKYGTINSKGQVTTPAAYSSILPIVRTTEPYASFKNPGSQHLGLLNMATGKIIIPAAKAPMGFRYEWGLVSFRRDNRQGLSDSTGREIFYDKYDDFVIGNYGGMNWVRNGNLYGFMDADGNEVVAPKYESILGFSDDRAAVKLNGLYGYIDKSGKLVIPHQYIKAESFQGGIARVTDKEGKVLFIDPDGKVL